MLRVCQYLVFGLLLFCNTALAQLNATTEFSRILSQVPALEQAVQKILKVAGSPEFIQNADAINKNPNRNTVVPLVLVFYLVYWLFKRRVMAASDRMLVRLSLWLVLQAVFWFGQFLILYLILGQPFLNLILALWGSVGQKN